MLDTVVSDGFFLRCLTVLHFSVVCGAALLVSWWRRLASFGWCSGVPWLAYSLVLFANFFNRLPLWWLHSAAFAASLLFARQVF